MVPSGDHHTARKGAPGTGQRERRGHNVVHPSRRAQGERGSTFGAVPTGTRLDAATDVRTEAAPRRLVRAVILVAPAPQETTLSDWSCNGSTGARQPSGKPTTAWGPARRGIPRAINPLSSPPACTKPDGASRSCNGNKEAFPAVRCDQPSKNSSPVRWRAPSGMPESHAPQKDSERDKPHRAAQLFPYFSKAQRGARRPSPRLP